MTNTVESLLTTYEAKKVFQDKGLTNVPDNIKSFTVALIASLKEADKNEEVEIKIAEGGIRQFVIVSTGQILAELKST